MAAYCEADFVGSDDNQCQIPGTKNRADAQRNQMKQLRDGVNLESEMASLIDVMDFRLNTAL